MSEKFFSRPAVSFHLHCTSEIWSCCNSEDVHFFFSFSFSINQSHKKCSYEYFLLRYLPYFHILIPHRVLFFAFFPPAFRIFFGKIWIFYFSISISFNERSLSFSRFSHLFSPPHFYIYFISFFSLTFFSPISLTFCLTLFLSLSQSLSAFLPFSLSFSLSFFPSHTHYL